MTQTSAIQLIFILQVGSCLFMTGLIWYVQIVVYPQLKQLPAPDFCRLHPLHTKRTGMVVALPMIVELLSGFLLLFYPPLHRGSSLYFYLFPLAALLMIWLSTLCLQIPLHARLEKRKDDRDLGKLCRGNWIRTFLWSLRSLWLLYAVYLCL